MTLRVVLDTNVVVSGFGWGGHPGQVLDAAVLTELLNRVSLVTDPPPTATILDDDDDNRLVDAAKAGNADVIITGDQLVLDADPIDNIRVVTPAEFLALLEQLDRR